MSERELAFLMMFCGVIRDIEEMSKDYYTRKQLYDMRQKLEKFLLFTGTYTKLFYKDKTFQ